MTTNADGETRRDALDARENPWKLRAERSSLSNYKGPDSPHAWR